MTQMDLVAEYMSRFEPLMNQILAQNPAYDLVFFTTRFVDGLRHDIRDMIVLHHPKDLDTAYSLDSIQENVCGTVRARPDRMDLGLSSRPGGRQPPLAATSPRLVIEGPPNDRCGGESRHTNDRRTTDDQLAALRAYRHARGLCFICGERWGQGHRCAPQVQLHMVEELLDMLQDHPGSPPVVNEEDSEEDSLMSISSVALKGNKGPKTLRPWGMIENQEILILVDLGSTHSFISTSVAALLKHPKTQILASLLRIADGGSLRCNSQLAACDWWVQGHSFVTDLRILKLGCYDMVLGMDWLETHSPIIHAWDQKRLSFMHKGHMIFLQGVSLFVWTPLAEEEFQELKKKLSSHLFCNYQISASNL